jgi:hypothetical protein
MLPAIPKSLGTLPLVFASALDAVQAKANPLALPKVRSAIVILVDGLGSHNLASRAGHAPFLSRAAAANKPLKSDFPSTTATSLTGFGTGLRAAEHGIIGYSLLGPNGPEVLNMLSGWGPGQDPLAWQPNETIAAKADAAGVTAHFVGPAEYQGSGFTKLTMRGAEYHSAKSIDDRLESALRIVRSGRNLVYVYVPELDQTAHSKGWESDAWIDLLEQLDHAVKRFASALPKGVGAILTADHGVLDVPSAKHIYLDEFGESVADFEMVAGDPRVNFVYLNDPSAAVTTAEKIADVLPSGVHAFTGRELVASGIFGGTSLKTQARTPDVIVMAVSNWAIYDRRFAKPQSLKMIGQHGSISPQEIEVPLAKFGDFGA